MGLAQIKMPQLGESVTEGTVDHWLKNEGDFVKRDEPLVEVVTDKVNAEIPSPFEGKLVKITAAQGETVRVGAVIAQIETGAAAAGAPAGQAPVKQAPSEAGVSQAAAEAPGPAPKDAESSPTPPPGPPAPSAAGGDGGVRLSPAVRKLAAEHNIDPSTIQGSGMGGRVTRDDILAVVGSSAGAAAAPAPTARPAAPAAAAERPQKQGDGAREELVKLSVMFPWLNSTWTDEGVVVKHYINMGIAVSIPDGLIVPVLKDTDQRGFTDLVRSLNDLIDRARNKQLKPEDVQGGTFTLNNTGATGSVASQPIINQPQAAILTTESILRRPVVVGDGIAIRHMMNMCLSFDHRIIDGMMAGQFLNTVKKQLDEWTPASIRL